MKNLGTIVAAVFLGIVLALYMCTFQVRFTEVAIKKTWGKVGKNPITDPGLYLKWPKPVQSVVVYDKRVRILEDRTEESRTTDGKNLLLATFTLWRIHDPVRFHTNFPLGEEDGEKKLRTTIVTDKHAVIAGHTFSDFVSTDPAQRKIRQIEEEMQAAVARDTLEQYGVEVVDFGIKKLGLPESVTTAIFESMKSHEEAKAERYRAEGDASAAKILADARAIESRIMAEVDRKVAEIQTEAERVVSEYYKEFDEYPALRIFLDTLRTLREALKERTTLILTDEQAPWSMFDKQTRAAVPRLELPPEGGEAPTAGKPD
jgi:membrane protease subunit HflC